MPSHIHKKPIIDEIRENHPEQTRDLILGAGASQPGLLSLLWTLMSETCGRIELAYRRGYDQGFEDGKKVSRAHAK